MPSKNPLISIVIPSYNRAHLIGQTIENIFEQSFEDYELIIVDDGSTDDTETAVASYLDRIVYIKQENKGITGARNTGLRAAKGEWIALQDSDDHWHPRKLEQQVEDMRTHPELDVFFLESILQRPHLGGDVKSFENSGFDKHLKSDEFTTVERPLHYHIKYGVAWVQATLIRKKTLFDVGLYDEWLGLFTDLDLFARLALLGPWGFNPTPLVTIQRVGDIAANISNQRTKTPAKAYRNLAYILEKIWREKGLDETERITIATRLRDAYSGLGNELVKSGDCKGARIAFRAANRVKPTLGPTVKGLRSFFHKQTNQSDFRPVPPGDIPNALSTAQT